MNIVATTDETTTTLPSRAVPTVDIAAFTEYDIESVPNVFTLAHLDLQGVESASGKPMLVIFYIIDEGTPFGDDVARNGFDTDACTRQILEVNPVCPRDIEVHYINLNTPGGALMLAQLGGMSNAEPINDPTAASDFDPRARITCDTDANYDPSRHPYRAGYNSKNYDMTMWAAWMHECFGAKAPGSRYTAVHPVTGQTVYVDHVPSKVTAKTMRMHNDALFDSHRDYMPAYLSRGKLGGDQGSKSLVNRLYQNMLSSGRHLDVSLLNELQKKVRLKYLFGVLGRQILESTKVSDPNSPITSHEELFDLLAYNVADIVNLDLLLHDKLYAKSFDQRVSLINEYPEMIYQNKRGTQKPDIDPAKVRYGRLTPDSTSAKLVANSLAPYDPLNDIETVSFNYPSKAMSEALGIPQVNVLDEAREFFHSTVSDSAARHAFDNVYEYFKGFEGKNFNDSDRYRERYSGVNDDGTYIESLPAISPDDVPTFPNTIHYYYPDGTPSSGYVNFSYGGIHGAEMDIEAFSAKKNAVIAFNANLDRAMAAYPDPVDMLRVAKQRYHTVTLPDGTTIDASHFLSALGGNKSKSAPNGVTTAKYYKNAPKVVDPSDKDTWAATMAVLQEHYPDAEDFAQTFRDNPLSVTIVNEQTGQEHLVEVASVTTGKTEGSIAYKRYQPTPEAFMRVDTNPDSPSRLTKLNPDYAKTSIGDSIHEDFSSYYPNMLMMLSAFYNEALGDDRYAKLYDLKEELGAVMDDESVSEDERALAGIARAGVKLLLNSASGAGGTQFDTNIRMNNVILSMRLIGQIFTWRIGQAATFAGGRVVSTNTDGLYVMDLDKATNDKILAEQTKIINVKIGPEDILLVSKDSNNRMDLARTGAQPWDTEIKGASGGDLACHAGPRLDKKLSHPAVSDHALAEYLRAIAGGYQPPWADHPLSIDDLADSRIIRGVLQQVADNPDKVHAARMFQHIITSSSSAHPFATDVHTEPTSGAHPLVNPRPLQHVNRAFYVRPGTPGAVNLHTAVKSKINDKDMARRRERGDRDRVINPVAADVLRANGDGVTVADQAAGKRMVPANHDVIVSKVTRVENTWPVLIVNDDLYEMDQQRLAGIIDSLDLEVYTNLVVQTFEKNWCNGDVKALRKARDAQVETQSQQAA